MFFSHEVIQAPSLKNVHWNTQTHTLSFAKAIVLFTPTEYRFIYPLRHGFPVAYAELASFVYQSSLNRKVRVMLDKHVDRIRGKLYGSGLYIYCVLGYGYMLFPEASSPKGDLLHVMNV